MYQNDNGVRIYSHTSLALWKLCKRRWHQRYRLGRKEPTTDNMAAGTWLVQEPIEKYHQRQRDRIYILLDDPDESHWANFLAEFGGGDSYNSGIFTTTLPSQVLLAYRRTPVKGDVVAIEDRFFKDMPTAATLYQSKPDLVVDRGGERVVWDIKLKTFNQSRVNDDFFVKPELSPFDDQGVGQAVCAGAVAFGQIQFWLGKKDGILRGPFYVERPLDPVLAQEWQSETCSEIAEIESWLKRGPHASWPKNDQSCNAFGRACSYRAECRFGFEAAPLTSR